MDRALLLTILVTAIVGVCLFVYYCKVEEHLDATAGLRKQTMMYHKNDIIAKCPADPNQTIASLAKQPQFDCKRKDGISADDLLTEKGYKDNEGKEYIVYRLKVDKELSI